MEALEISTFGEPSDVVEQVTIPDPDHSEGEARYLILGRSSRGRVLVVSHTERGENIRIISARGSDARERRKYGK